MRSQSQDALVFVHEHQGDKQIFTHHTNRQEAKPFDGRHPLTSEVFFYPSLFDPHAFKTVEINVIKRKSSPIVFSDKSKGSARDFVFVEAETNRQSFDETGLSCPEVPIKTNHRPWEKQLSKSSAPGLGFFR